MRNLQVFGALLLTLSLFACGEGGSGGGGKRKAAGPASTPPGKPAAFDALPGDGQVGLAWAPPATGGAPASYKIYRSNGTDPLITGTVIHQAGASDSAYMDTSVANSIPYYYALVATNAVGDGPPTHVVEVTPKAGLPGAPLNLAAVSGDLTVDLTWTAPVDGGEPTTYKMYRAVVEANLTASGDQWDWAVTNPTAYADTAVVNFTTYYYAVRASNPTGDGPISNVASAIPNDGPPGAPQNATATAGNREVSLSWEAPATGQTFEYRVYRGDAADFPATEPLTTLASDSLTYLDQGLNNYQTYYYRIQAVNPAGASEFTNEISAWPNDGPPGQPQSLSTSAGDASVTLTWEAPATGGLTQTYRIYRSTTSEVALTDEALVGSVPVGTLTFDDTSDLVNYATYYYAVVASNPVGPGTATPAVAEMPGLLPNAPSALAAETGAAPVVLSWNAPTPGGRVDGYAVYRSSTPGVNTGGNSTLTATTTSATDNGTANNQGYYYRVAATNPKGQGPASDEIYVYPKDFTVPVESDPPPTQASGDQVGRSVAIDGTYALVGAPRRDYGLTDAGAVYVYERQSNGSWLRGPTLAKSAADGDPLAAEQFGFSVAIAGDVAVVGAPLANWPLTGGNGNGRVYVFRRQSNNTWLHEKDFQSNTVSVPDQFGIAVAADGTTAIVGARQDQAASNADGCGVTRGAVYFFDISQGSGSTQLARFEPVIGTCTSERLSLAEFGQSVAISGDFAIVGAPREKTNATQETLETGAAYFYRRVNGTWQHLSSEKKTTSSLLAHFGMSVAIRGTLAAVGAPRHVCFAPNVACPSGTLSLAGAVYLYQWNGSAWVQLTVLRPQVASQGENFGQSIALESGTVVVGAGNLSTTATTRRVYRCDDSSGSWSCQATLVVQETNNLAESGITPTPLDTSFGLAIDGGNLVVGRPSADRVGQAATDDAGDVDFY